MEDKLKIQEIIVVEGKDDTKRIQEVVTADTIETIGSAINEEILERIAHAQEIRGVIVFTDPDFSGEKIRKIITDAIPDVKHAFISRRLATPAKRGASLGVEHASDEAIIEALKNVMTPQDEGQTEEIPQELLIRYGLIAGSKAKARREALGDCLRIGYTNGKQLRKRLKMFQLSEEELVAAMEIVLKGEIDGV